MSVTLAGAGVRYCDQSGQVCAAIINRDTDVDGRAELTQFARNGPAVRFAVRFSEDPMPNCWSHGHVYLDAIFPGGEAKSLGGTMQKVIHETVHLLHVKDEKPVKDAVKERKFTGGRKSKKS